MHARQAMRSFLPAIAPMGSEATSLPFPGSLLGEGHVSYLQVGSRESCANVLGRYGDAVDVSTTFSLAKVEPG